MSPSERELPSGLAEAIKDLGPEDLQACLGACVNRYVTLREEGHDILPFLPGGAVNATAVVETVSSMLDQVDIEIFELAMWQSWGRV